MNKMSLRFAAVLALATTAFLAIATPSAHAQKPMGAPRPAGSDPTKELGLTPDQKTKIQAISKKYQPQMMQIQQKAMAPYKAQMEAIQKDTVSTPAQKNEKMKPILKKMMGTALPEVKATMNKMFDEMSGLMTAAQKPKFAKIRADQMQKFDAQMKAAGG